MTTYYDKYMNIKSIFNKNMNTINNNMKDADFKIKIKNIIKIQN